MPPDDGAVYYGIAAGATNEAVRVRHGAGGRGGKPTDARPGRRSPRRSDGVQASDGLVGAHGQPRRAGDDYQYALVDEHVNTVLLAKRCVVTQAIEVVDLAMEAVGGAAYFKRSPLERAYRDVRAGTFHPLPPEKTLQFAGRVALGQPIDCMW